MDKVSEISQRVAFDRWLIVLIAALIIGSMLRFWGLDVPSLSHPEIYIPGIDLVPGISEPPSRHAFFETLEWQFQSETHPVGYYMAMWIWTSIAGTSEFALRLPGVAIGTLTIWLIWRLGSGIFSRQVGAIAALLLALHGFHIYWSQMARMYAPCAALAVLATLLLMIWMRTGERRPLLEAGYALTLMAGTQTVELFWAVPFLHLFWAGIVKSPPSAPSWKSLLLPWKLPALRIVQVQTMAIAIAAADFVHIARKAQAGTEILVTPPQFLVEYFAFGFLFQTTEMLSIFDAPSLMAALGLACLALAAIIMSLREHAAPIPDTVPAAIPFRWVALAAIFGTTLSFYLVGISPRHKLLLSAIALLPALCLWLPVLNILAGFVARRLPAPLKRGLAQADPFSILLALLACVPPLLFFSVSFFMSVLAPRAFLPFIPFFLLLVAAGFSALGRIRWLQLPALVSMILLFVLSSAYFHYLPHSPRDYKAVAAIIMREGLRDDVVFVRPRHWQDTPLFYYLPASNYVAERYARYLADHGPTRVWLPEWTTRDGKFRTDERRAILVAAGYREAKSWPASQARTGIFIASRTNP